MSYVDALQHHVQRMVMADFGLTWEQVQWDAHGDICFRNEEDRVVTVFLIDRDSTTWARVFVQAGKNLKRSAKLLREVNELNVSLRSARALVTQDGRLILAAEVIAESLEPDELNRLVDILSENAERSGEMIQLMFGAPTDSGCSTKQVEP